MRGRQLPSVFKISVYGVDRSASRFLVQQLTQEPYSMVACWTSDNPLLEAHHTTHLLAEIASLARATTTVKLFSWTTMTIVMKVW